MNLENHLLGLVFPRRCFICKKLILEDLLACFACLGALKLPVSSTLTMNGITVKVYSLFPYRYPFNQIVLSKFYYDTSLFSLTAKTMPYLCKNLYNKGFFEQATLVPIPIHWWRHFLRGFNQAEVFAKHIAENFELPVCNALLRKKWTTFQSALASRERHKNVSDALTVSDGAAAQVKNRKIILIDDLCTTGATLLAAAKALRPLAPCEITALVICH